MSRRDIEDRYKALAEKSHFDFDDVEMLNEIFQLLKSKKGPGKGTLERVAFRDILMTSFKMSDDMMMDRIVLGLSTTHDYDSKITFEEFVTGMSIFMRGNLEEHIDFGFRVYDCLKRDGFITREEMHQLLGNTIVTSPSEEDTEEMIRDLIELLIKKMDHDKDHRISKEDFAKSAREDALLLQVFGPYLPEKVHTDQFLTEKTINVYKQKYT